MTDNITYAIRMIISTSNSDILHAQCGCPAGCGPKGSCKHIAAMCYALEDFSHIKNLCENPVACTSQLQTWNQPRKIHLEPIDVHEIKFVKQQYGKQTRVSNISHYDPRPVSFPKKNTRRSTGTAHKTFRDIALRHVLSVDNSS